MALTIILNTEEASRVQREASTRGLEPVDYAHQLIAENLPRTSPTKRRSAMAKYSHSQVSSEEFLCRRHEENIREERLWFEQQGKRSA